MRVNVYAEEMTDRIEIIAKVIDGRAFTGLRFYLELPATVNGEQYRGPFMHRLGDDDSSAVTFWGKRDLRVVLRKALTELDRHYAESASPPRVPGASAHDVTVGVESGPGQPITYTTVREQDRAEGFRSGIEAAATHLAATTATRHLADEVRALADAPAPDPLLAGLQAVHKEMQQMAAEGFSLDKSNWADLCDWLDSEIAARKGG